MWPYYFNESDCQSSQENAHNSINIKVILNKSWGVSLHSKHYNYVPLV